MFKFSASGIILISTLLSCMIISIPFGGRLEQQFGISLLYKLRGPVTPPSDVAMVYIDSSTANQFIGKDEHGHETREILADELKYWPRSVHACVLKKLKKAGAKAVVFDIAFLRSQSSMQHPEGICDEILPGSNADEVFIEAVKEFKNVILLEYIEQENLLSKDGFITSRRLVKPFKELSNVALGTAPYVLRDPTNRLDTFPTFVCPEDNFNSSNDCQEKWQHCQR